MMTDVRGTMARPISVGTRKSKGRARVPVMAKVM